MRLRATKKLKPILPRFIMRLFVRLRCDSADGVAHSPPSIDGGSATTARHSRAGVSGECVVLMFGLCDVVLASVMLFRLVRCWCG